GAGGAGGRAGLGDAERLRRAYAGPKPPKTYLAGGDHAVAERLLRWRAVRAAEREMPYGQVLDGGDVLVREPGRQAGQEDDEQGDERDDAPHQGETPLGDADVAQRDEHDSPQRFR